MFGVRHDAVSCEAVNYPSHGVVNVGKRIKVTTKYDCVLSGEYCVWRVRFHNTSDHQLVFVRSLLVLTVLFRVSGVLLQHPIPQEFRLYRNRPGKDRRAHCIRFALPYVVVRVSTALLCR